MLSFDTETALMRPALLAPPLACVTYSDGERDNIVHWTEAHDTCAWLLEQEVTTANGSYDLAVTWAQFPDLRDLVWEGLVAGRYHDVLIRQKLMDIGSGHYRKIFRRIQGEEKATPLRYGLSDLHARYYGQRMEKDEWRLRYGELRNLPLKDWHPGAIKYATYDAVATARIHDLQTAAAIQQGHTNNLHDEAAQMRAAFALHVASCWGVRCDEKQVERVIAYIDTEQPELAKTLEKAFLVRWEKNKDGYVRNEKNAKALMFRAVGDSGELTKTGYEKVKKRELTKAQALEQGYIKIDEEWCEASGDENLVAYYHFRQNQLLRSKLRHIHTAAKAGLPIQTSYEVLMETGRTSSSESKVVPENSMALQNPPRKPIMEDMVDAHNRLILDEKGKKKKREARDARGRIIGGMRECFLARPGCTLIACDYGQAELVSLAQVTYAAFGQSKMRDLLNAKMDIHIDFGKEVMATKKGVRLSYEEAWALHKKKDKELKEYRQMAKCFHPDTEVLTKRGWKKVSDLTGKEEVAAARFHDGGRTSIHWEVPTRLTTRKTDELVHLQNENIDLLVTPDHRMAAWALHEIEPLAQVRDPKTGRRVAQGGRQRKKHLVSKICTPEEMVRQRAWPSAGLCEEGSTEVDERLIRLAVAVQADGHYEKDRNSIENGRVKLGFKKKRKIERLRQLLKGIEHTVGHSQGVTTFYIPREAAVDIRDLLDSDKTLPWWWLNLRRDLREAVLDEAQHWDSNIQEGGRGSWLYGSTIQKNTDVLQAIASITNRKATRRKQERDNDSHANLWHLSVKDRANTRGGQLEAKRVPWGRDVFCLTVPSDAVLVRYRGKTVVTRQCADFGFPGGLGWASFKSYARKAWNVELTDEESKQLKSYWLRHFPEMKLYFKWMSDLVEAGDGLADIQQYMSGRWRGRCFYTQGCNTLFQGLTADAAKAAFFEVSRLCYTAKSSDLYGCRPLLFVHDEIITEAPLEQAAAAAKEMERVMIEVYSQYTPDVRITADAHLMERWSKDAEATFDERGKLIPWAPPESEDERAEEWLIAA